MSSLTIQRTRKAVSTYSPARHVYTVFVALSILLLICSGGMVTSKDAGLTVPDWPNSYGYNMFAFPVSRWVGGIFFEHTHRLVASFVGMLTVGLAVWLARAEPRRWVRSVGYIAVGAVILQGLLGGLRVTMLKDWIGVPHALLAQAFFALMVFLALTQSRWWQRLGNGPTNERAMSSLVPLRRTVAVVTGMIYMQLGLGAAMRHAHAGLSILDFPKAYGHWWPHVHRDDLPALNSHRVEDLHLPATSLAQIHLQMTHRMMAGLILLGVLSVAALAWKRRALLPTGLRWLGTAWPVVVAMEVTLGIYTIWTQKAADVATAHVAVGATSLVWGVVTYAALRRWTAAPGVEAISATRPERSLVEVAV